MNHRIKDLLSEIENNLSQTLTVQKLAKSLGVSVSHFEHLFKQEVGSSPAKHIKNLRLQKAREFLETTNLSVKEIRAKVGIRNKVHFFRDFKQKFGTTPTEYRKNFHEQQKRRVNSKKSG